MQSLTYERGRRHKKTNNAGPEVMGGGLGCNDDTEPEQGGERALDEADEGVRRSPRLLMSPRRNYADGSSDSGRDGEEGAAAGRAKLPRTGAGSIQQHRRDRRGGRKQPSSELLPVSQDARPTAGDLACAPPSGLVEERLEAAMKRMTDRYEGACQGRWKIASEFEAVFREMDIRDITRICDEKLGWPPGTKTMPSDLLRKVEFDGILKFLQGPIPPHLPRYTEEQFYREYLASIVNCEWRLRLRVRFGQNLARPPKSDLSSKAGCLLFGLSRRVLQFPLKLSISSFSQLRDELGALLEFVLRTNHPEQYKDGSDLGHRWKTAVGTPLVKTFLAARQELVAESRRRAVDSIPLDLSGGGSEAHGNLMHCDKENARDEDEASREEDEASCRDGGCDDDSSYCESSSDSDHDGLLTKPGGNQSRRQRQVPPLPGPHSQFEYWQGAQEGSIESVRELKELIPYLRTAHLDDNGDVKMDMNDSIKFFSSPFVVEKVHRGLVE